MKRAPKDPVPPVTKIVFPLSMKEKNYNNPPLKVHLIAEVTKERGIKV